MQLAQEDLSAIIKLREAGVLEDFNPSKVDHHGQGVTVVSCSDGDQIYEILTHLAGAVITTRIHVLASHGGALRIPEKSPLVFPDLRVDAVLLNDIAAVPELKGITTLLLYAHLPCGIAKKHGLDSIRVIALLKEAKNRLQTELPYLQVIPLLHVDYGEGNGIKNGGSKKRTYFVSGQAWRDWIARGSS